MLEPIEFRIIKNLQAALRAMDTAAGYYYNVAACDVLLDIDCKVEAHIPPNGPRPHLVIEPLPESWQYFPAEQLKLLMPVRIHWLGLSTPSEDDSLLQTFFRGCADIEKAIAIDTGRGGLAVDTRITRRYLERELSAGAEVWAILNVDIKLHRTYGQPSA